MTNSEKFALALAFVNCGNEVSLDDLDMYGVCAVEDVVSTQETIDMFQSARNSKGGMEKTPFGEVIFWKNEQAQGKGTKRGTLYVMDNGSERNAYFSS